MERSRHGRTTPSRTVTAAEQEGRPKQRAYCVAVLESGDDLSELHELLRTAGVAVVGQSVQHREKPHPNSYVGPGKLEEIKAEAKAADANVIVCDDELSPRQERNLEAALEMPVIDRTATILDIFAGHAHTADGKLQVELAQLQYNLARMRGLWTHLERRSARASVPADRAKARSRPIAAWRATVSPRSSAASRRSRGRADHARRARARAPAEGRLAGYTNAGKSTLLNQLTGRDGRGPRPAVPHARPDDARRRASTAGPYLFTDTVGFIRKLPHQLVDAFGATLEETQLADLVLHVVDASVVEDEMLEMLRAVEVVLEEIGAADRPRLLVLNKADALDAERRTELAHSHPDGILVSALTGEGLEALGLAIADAFARRCARRPAAALSEGGRLAELHGIAGDDLVREDTPEGVRVKARLPAPSPSASPASRSTAPAASAGARRPGRRLVQPRLRRRRR